jgi:hypothetical protein
MSGEKESWQRRPARPESVKIGGYTLPLPRSRLLRIVIGVLL